MTSSSNTVAPRTIPHGQAEKPEKFSGLYLKRWQQKMLFYLTTLGVAGYIKEKAPVVEENESDVNKRTAPRVPIEAKANLMERGGPSNSNKRKRPGQVDKGKKPMTKFNVNCFNCDKPGHMSKYCTAPKKKHTNYGAHLAEHNNKGKGKARQDDWDDDDLAAVVAEGSSEKRTSEAATSSDPVDEEPRHSKRARTAKTFGPNFITYMLDDEPKFRQQAPCARRGRWPKFEAHYLYDEPRERRRDRRSPDPSGLLVRNISLSSRPEDLRVPFERFGPVKDVYLPKNYFSGEPRGFGFVKFRYPEDAAEAKSHMDRKVIGGREIRIVFAEENRKTPQEMLLEEATGDGVHPCPLDDDITLDHTPLIQQGLIQEIGAMEPGTIATLDKDQDLCLDQFLLEMTEVTGPVRGLPSIPDPYLDPFLHRNRKTISRASIPQVLEKMEILAMHEAGPRVQEETLVQPAIAEGPSGFLLS
ncbi:SC35-like splicing factor 28 [Perilla frutescens var. frutescens]|nr:SC35-like splicing factor 28 [Perilla frutescens var. frutescens]